MRTRWGPPPRSCDTFVALPPATAHGGVVFGKNSDRPSREVQLVEVHAAATHGPESTVQCTYISIPQAASTLAVALSRPKWMWGAEMAANEAGLVIGNEAVWTKEPIVDDPPALLGMDLVRLAAERCRTAEEAVSCITSLLEEFGQAGACEEGGGSFTYHNSFLIADRSEAWVLETAGKWWAAERVTSGCRNISNCLSIRTKFERCSAGLREYAIAAGYFDGQDDLDFALAFSDDPPPPKGRKTQGRESAGWNLLRKASSSGAFGPNDMMSILRDRRSGICMPSEGFRTNGAQVSLLARPGTDAQDVHFFTGTPDPSRGVFKPLAFVGEFDAAAAADIYAAASKLYDGADRALKKFDRIAAELSALEGTGLEAAEQGTVTLRTYLDLVREECALH
ncbi:secernin-2-like protein [Hyaloraphidium curvatum]|nr:secernin-2-like protein [Hyaloraphidium curvatum]